MSPASAPETAKPASLVVVDPSGHRTRIEIRPLPFRIGRHADNHLVIRDNRASRNHAHILVENGEYVIEDLNSRHGTFVNGTRVQRQVLHSYDRIELGFPDSYQLTFALDGAELGRLMHQFSHEQAAAKAGVGGNLGKLRAVLEVARTLQTGFSMHEVLNAVVDAALAITGMERGFLLLRNGEELETCVARDRNGAALQESELRVPRRVIQRALEQRRDLFSMNFDKSGADSPYAGQSVADLELRSVVCVPLIRINTATGEETRILSSNADAVGVLYMDSRQVNADLAGGNRELLQTLVIEASTVLENVRLLEEERLKQKIEEELEVARTIQQSLLPRQLPSEGWLRASGSSVASYQVGGDYFDVVPVHDSCWAAVVADVSGKGVSSALLASLLQGAFWTVSDRTAFIEHRLRRINRLLIERTAGDKYATIFCCLLDRAGRLSYINAGHCSPMVVSADGSFEYLEATAMPVGIVEQAEFTIVEKQLSPHAKIIIYTDGITEAQNPAGEFFGRKRLHEIVLANAKGGCSTIHDAVQSAVANFADNAAQSDDVTLLVLEYHPAE